jgi:large subunit ribosomal protein L29
MRNSFKTLTFPELKAKRDELSRKYLDFRFQLVIGHVDNPLQKRQLRRQIARLNTLIRQHEIAQQQSAKTSAVNATPTSLVTKA